MKNPNEGGCWFCHKDNTDDMDFSLEFDCYLHMSCLDKALAKGNNPEAEIMDRELRRKSEYDKIKMRNVNGKEVEIEITSKGYDLYIGRLTFKDFAAMLNSQERVFIKRVYPKESKYER